MYRAALSVGSMQRQLCGRAEPQSMPKIRVSSIVSLGLPQAHLLHCDGVQKPHTPPCFQTVACCVPTVLSDWQRFQAVPAVQSISIGSPVCPAYSAAPRATANQTIFREQSRILAQMSAFPQMLRRSPLQ